MGVQGTVRAVRFSTSRDLGSMQHDFRQHRARAVRSASSRLTPTTVGRRLHGGRRTKLTLRGKVVLACLIALISWFGWSMMPQDAAHSEQGAIEVVNYTVRPGDTLWSYASDITPKGGDVSQSVDELMDLNDLDSATLHPGQVLIVPAQ